MNDKIKNHEILFSPGSTYWGDVWLQFKKHKGALLGAIIFFWYCHHSYAWALFMAF